MRSGHLEILGFPMGRVVPTNTGIFWPGLKLCGESRFFGVLLVSKKKKNVRLPPIFFLELDSPC